MTSPRFVPPWADDFTNDANNAWAQVTQDVSAATGGLVNLQPPPIPTTSVTHPTPTTTTTVTTVSPSAAPVTVPAPSATSIGTDILAQLAPGLESQLENYAKAYVQAILAGKHPAVVPNVILNGENLTHEAAKSHGLRTFMIGLGTTAFSAVVTALGTATHIDFFSKEGWIATGTLLVGSVVSAAASYISRLQITPAYEQKLLAAPPQPLSR